MNYSARAFAQITGVTVKALRHYERRGLLTPHRTDAGYRRYTLLDLQRLEEILALKSLGLPLSQIPRLSGGQDVEALRAQRERLVDARARLDRAIAALDAVAEDADPPRALRRFVTNASWERWEEKRRDASQGVPRPPDRVSASRLELFHDVAAALEAGVVSDDGPRALARRRPPLRRVDVRDGARGVGARRHVPRRSARRRRQCDHGPAEAGHY